jgi:DUF1680 family protein
MKSYLVLIVSCIVILCSNVKAQDKLYRNAFSLSDVTLLEGPFKHAQDLNINTLLQYNVDRLLAPYLKEAGLTPKDSSYSNWIGLDGHIGGHYLSAMAIHYASTGNVECKQRMDYMILELKACQDANGADPDFIGYVGGVPDGKPIWLEIKKGNPSAIWKGWVPLYNIHKMYAGLRDAWLYGGNDTARAMFLKFCDWGIELCKGLSDSQMESLLTCEYGGMNEVYADAYQITGDNKYLIMAKRFSHKLILDSMAKKVDNLDNMHANTQVPKAVGFQRIAEISNDSYYYTAADFFWKTVSQNRSLAFGGNSRQEFFPQASACTDYITVREGPESCNTYNMLKLSEGLFRMKPDACYADFYERALYNHILSSQHPEHGGYVYFTPARPSHYRVYSAPNMAMWCCVGTGMENHGKYGEFIYTHRGDTLFLNLFIASKLDWKEKGIAVTQETQFPDEEKSKLTIHTSSPTSFKLMIRHPFWIYADSLKVIVNNDTLSLPSQASSYAVINRTWDDEDVVEVLLPMQNRLEELPNVSSYVAVMHGPILLAAKTGTQDLTGLIADDSRWGHIAHGSLVPLKQIPFILGERSTILSKIQPVKEHSLAQTLNLISPGGADTTMVLEPFFRIHDSRYIMYWMALTQAEYQDVFDSLAMIEQKMIELDKRTIDALAPGQQQPETDHQMKTLNSESGIHQEEFWRHARDGGFISYTMSTNNELNLKLLVRYWGNEWGSRQFDILIDGELLASENIHGKWNKSEFVNVEYPIPDSMVKGKKSVEVRFQAKPGNYAGGLYNVRILRNTPVIND